MSQERYKVTQDESSGRLGLYRRILSDVPGSVVGWEKIASVEDFRHIAQIVATVPEPDEAPTRKETSQAIASIEGLARAAELGLCDSATGFCTMHRRVLAAAPHLNQCAKILRNQQNEKY